MGKAALIAVLAFGVMGTVYALSSGQARMSTEGHTAAYQHEVTARSAAMAGLELAKQALADNFTSPPSALKGTYGGIPYSVSVTTSGSIATVTSTASAKTANGSEIPFNIRASYELKLDVLEEYASEAPAFMQYAMLTEDALLLHGNVDVKIGVEGNLENQLNANVHSNTSLTAQGNVYVEGFGSSAGPVEVIGASQFNPFTDVESSAITAFTEKVDIPSFNLITVAATVGTSCFTTGCPGVLVSNSGLKVTNNSQVQGLSGTYDNPTYWIVRGGMLEINANVTIPGHTVFIAEDGFRISGSVNIGGSSSDMGDISKVAIYTPARGELHVTGNSEIHAQIYAETGVDIKGNVRVYGNITTRETVTIGGNVSIFYRQASPALTKIWQDVSPYIELISYNEW